MTGADEALRQRPRGIRPAIPRLLGDERLARMAADGADSHAARRLPALNARRVCFLMHGTEGIER